PDLGQSAGLSRGGRDRGPQRLAARPDIPWLARLMYARILVPLEHSPADETILAHVRELARRLGSALVLVHVADGWVARNIKELDLRESEEMRDDRAYLEDTCARLVAEGFDADAVLAAGDPAQEIAAVAERERCDLIAMATHGHRLLEDVLRGSTATALRHHTMVPILMVRAEKKYRLSLMPFSPAPTPARAPRASGRGLLAAARCCSYRPVQCSESAPAAARARAAATSRADPTSPRSSRGAAGRTG